MCGAIIPFPQYAFMAWCFYSIVMISDQPGLSYSVHGTLCNQHISSLREMEWGGADEFFTTRSGEREKGWTGVEELG
jgi:hypothetical protein